MSEQVAKALIANAVQLRERSRRYALIELGDSEAIGLFLREQDARRALEECLSDEPDWAGLL
jgi:predicted ATPase